jgi:hypothetical protein
MLVVYNDVRGDHDGPIVLTRSRDGKSWSSPKAIITGRTQHFTATIAAARDGTLGLTWYDFRNDRPGDGKLTTDYWFAFSNDKGNTWRQIHVGGPFDARTAVQASLGVGPAGHFIGEYQGLSAVPGGFDAAFTQSTPRTRHDRSDIFFASIRLHVVPRARHRAFGGRPRL